MFTSIERIREYGGRQGRRIVMNTVLLYDRMPFMFTPAQLQFLASQVESVRDVPGDVLELGCAYGATTVYLNRHMVDLNIAKQYTCIDTFAGFTQRDIAYERDKRGRRYSYHDFRANSKRRFERTLRMNHIRNVVVHRADVVKYPLRNLGPIAFCLLDLDMYIATMSALSQVWEVLSPGGVLVVDDCLCRGGQDRFAGAGEAYYEFAAMVQQSPHLVMGKLGYLRKPL